MKAVYIYIYIYIYILTNNRLAPMLLYHSFKSEVHRCCSFFLQLAGHIKSSQPICTDVKLFRTGLCSIHANYTYRKLRINKGEIFSARDVKAFEEVEVQHHSFLTLVLHKRGWSASSPGSFTPGKSPQHPLNGRLGVTHSPP